MRGQSYLSSKIIANIALQIAVCVLASLGILFRGISSEFVEAYSDTPCNQKQPHADQIIMSYNQSIALSPPLLRKLAEKDEIIYAVVRRHYNYTHGDYCYHHAVKRYLKHFEITTGSLILHFHEDGVAPYRPVNVAWNPLATYHLLNRFHTVFKQLVMSLNDTDEGQYALARQIRSIMSDVGWPTEDDLLAAISSILRIQHIYDLSTTHLSRGIIVNREYGISFFPDDCVAIGQQALSERYFYLAVEWFEEALRIIDGDQKEKEQRREREIVENHLQIATSIHDAEFEKSRPCDTSFFRHKLSQEPRGNRETRRTYLHEDVEAAIQMKCYGFEYWDLCAGENLMSEEERTRLFCYYETKANPAWYIKPLKVEILSRDQLLVVQYHDLLSKSRTKQLRSDASGRLTPSMTRPADGEGTRSDTRTSSTARIDVMPEYSDIPRMIELITGLRVGPAGADAEKLRVVAYSSGNHYGPHTDALSDVIEGGATVFPLSDLTVTPVEGSAIMWYNLRQSGQQDPRTIHSSCPVIIGEKWIVSKFILGSHQTINQQFQCGKDANANEPIGIMVNGLPIDDAYL